MRPRHQVFFFLSTQDDSHVHPELRNINVFKMFSVQLSLGEQTWESEGSSIKKAQQAVANKALTESTLPKPVQKPPKSNVNNNPGSITPTVELNGLAMKRGEPAIYRPLDPKPFPNYRANYNFRGMYNQRFVCLLWFCSHLLFYAHCKSF
uniref:Staufen double-stranded RNA binding protein 2 n=1 Tax=Lynx canadensis TaxID=61383 RepID=A0A667I7I9_LYNCA